MTSESLSRLLEMSKRISLEKNYNRLLEGILENTMSLADCDAGVLYLKEGDFLSFKILRNDTLKSYLGGDGKAIQLPPIPVYGGHPCLKALLNDEVLTVGEVKNCKEPRCFFTILYDEWKTYDSGSMLAVSLRSRKGEMIGVMQLLNCKNADGTVVPFTEDDIGLIKSAASQAAVSIQNMRYLEDIKELFQSFVRVLSTAIDERIPFNAAHTRNMVRYGEGFIDYLNKTDEAAGKEPFFSENHKEEFLMSVWLHDIGKLVIPLEVLNKASRLIPSDLTQMKMRFDIMCLQNKIALLESRISEAEYGECEEDLRRARQKVEYANSAEFLSEEEIADLHKIAKKQYRDVNGVIQTWFTEDELVKLSVVKGTLTEQERLKMEGHVVMTEKLLSQIRFSKEYENVPYWASMHHEYLDGSGYPKKLTAEEIPLEVRILTILDIFEAMTAKDRPYKAEIPVQNTLDTLKAMAESGKLDASLVKKFIDSRCWEQPDAE